MKNAPKNKIIKVYGCVLSYESSSKDEQVPNEVIMLIHEINEALRILSDSLPQLSLPQESEFKIGVIPNDIEDN